MNLAPDSFALPALGHQADSMKDTEPSWTFGCSSRDKQEMQYFSAKMEKTKTSKISPGPIYTLPNDLGKAAAFGFGTAPQRFHRRALYPDSSVDLMESQVDSQPLRYPGTAGFLFGTEPKDCGKNIAAFAKTVDGGGGAQPAASPGPTAYYPDWAPVKARASEKTFGGRTKVAVETGSAPPTVGPASYGAPLAIGDQTLSQRHTLPSFGFGTAPRSKELRASDAVLDPNPDPSSFGRQVRSKMSSQPAVGMGTGTREHRAKTALICTPLDRGPMAFWKKPQLPHPDLAIHSERIRFS